MTYDAPDTGTCARCGMPLAYDHFINGNAHTVAPTSAVAGVWCSYCSTHSGPTDSNGRENDKSWLFSLLMRVYRSDRSIARTLANTVVKAQAIAPGPALAVSQLVASVPKRRPGARADAVVLYSGGKDSSWMLNYLRQNTDLRLIAWMLDQGYQSPTALQNARRLCDNIGVELVIEKPDREPMDALFRLGFEVDQDGDDDLIRSAMTYGSACWPCFATIAAQAAVFCHDNDLALCFIGTQKGQNRLDLHGRPVLVGGGLPQVESLVEKFVSNLRRHALERAPGSSHLLTAAACDTVLVPFYEMVPKPPYDKQIDSLRSVGWNMPKNTGACSTNCMMNELGRKVMRTQYGFDLYQVIDANERRNSRQPEPAGIAPLDENAVRRGAKVLKLTPIERVRYRIDEETP